MPIGHQTPIVFGGTSLSSVSSSSASTTTDEIQIVVVATRGTVSVSSVTVGSLSLDNIHNIQDGQNQCRLSVWRGRGISGTVSASVSLASTANAVCCVWLRITGADQSGTNGSGAIGATAYANQGGTDTSTPSVALTTTAANSRVYGCFTHRFTTFTVGTGWTSTTINNKYGTSGNDTSVSIEHQDVASANTNLTVNGTLSSATDWVVIAIEIKPDTGSSGSPPPTPTGLTATAGNGQVALSWNASSGATGYRLKRSTTSGGPYSQIGGDLTTTSYTDTNVTNGTTYYYVVSAFNSFGESANSSQVSATPGSPPPTPTGLTATAGNGQVALSWNASSGATGYRLKRSTTSGGPYSQIGGDLTTTSYTDTNVTNGTTYYYVVSAFNSFGESANSSQASATLTGSSGGTISVVPSLPPTRLGLTVTMLRDLDGVWMNESNGIVLPITTLSFGTNTHGASVCRFTVPVSFMQQLALYHSFGGARHIRVHDSTGMLVWAGRIEDFTMQQDQLLLVAYGYWRHLYDCTYTAFWSSTDTSQWKVMPNAYGADHGRFEYRTDGGIYIAFRKNEKISWNGTDGYIGLALHYQLPAYNISTEIATGIDRFTANYRFVGPNLMFTAVIIQTDTTGAYVSTLWTLNSNGAVQNGVIDLSSLNIQSGGIAIVLRGYGPLYTYTGETGDAIFEISNPRIRWKHPVTGSHTISPDAIVHHIRVFMQDQQEILQTVNSFIESPGWDLSDERYEDVYPGDILINLTRLGNETNPTERWITGVTNERYVYFCPQSRFQRTWYIDVGDIEITQTIEDTYNGVYAIYRDAYNRIARTAVAYNILSFNRVNLKRITGVQANTNNGSMAINVRNATLKDRSRLRTRAMVTISGLYTDMGAPAIPYHVKAGDRVIIRNLLATPAMDLDILDSFIISETRYDANTNMLEIVPEEPQKTLDTLLAWREHPSFPTQRPIVTVGVIVIRP